MGPLACPSANRSVASPPHASHAARPRRRRRLGRARRARRRPLPGGRRSTALARRRHSHAGGFALRPGARDRSPLPSGCGSDRRTHARATPARRARAPRSRRPATRGARARGPCARSAGSAGGRDPPRVSTRRQHQGRGARHRALGMPSRTPSRRRGDVADAHAPRPADPGAGARAPGSPHRPSGAGCLLSGGALVAAAARHQGRPDRVSEARRLLARRALDDQAVRRTRAEPSRRAVSPAPRRPCGATGRARLSHAARGRCHSHRRTFPPRTAGEWWASSCRP